MAMNILKEYIKFLLESDDEEDKTDNLLLEPDYVEEREEAEDSQDEVSAVGAGGGAMAASGQMVGHTGGRTKSLDKNRFGKRNYANYKKKK